MGGGGQQTEQGEPVSRKGTGVYTWEEVQKHCSRNDQWLVINRKVYNITQWARRHPGGARVISHYAGEDATFFLKHRKGLFTCNVSFAAANVIRLAPMVASLPSFICGQYVLCCPRLNEGRDAIIGANLTMFAAANKMLQEPFSAFHPDLRFVQKFLKPLLVGELATTEPSQDGTKNEKIMEDFEHLRAQVEKEGLFQSKPLFFCLQLGHILLLEVLAWLMVSYWGTSWTLTLLSSLFLGIAQSQAGWLQHDFGHLSVFKKSKWNHLVHKFVMGHIKGASANWWNHRHFQHHAKPNVFRKDPDVNMLHVFVLGNTQPVEYGTKKIKYLPYNHQHQYFFLVGPPLLMPFYFQFEIMRAMFSQRDWVDVAWSFSYYFRFFCSYCPLYGFFGSLALLTFVRFIDSQCFVWVTQMNHIPMEIEYEKRQDWLTMQLKATCNIEQSAFNDWFCGHLNFQIEHHLFPTMPRHNYHLVSQRVHALCEKHGVSYEMKNLWRGMTDVVSSLKTSGDLWLDAYLHK